MSCWDVTLGEVVASLQRPTALMWEHANMADNQHISLKFYGLLYMLCHYSRHTPPTRVSVELLCRCLTNVTQQHEILVSNFLFTPGIKMVDMAKFKQTCNLYIYLYFKFVLYERLCDTEDTAENWALPSQK